MISQISAFVSSPVATDPPAVAFPGVVPPEPPEPDPEAELESPSFAPAFGDGVTVGVGEAVVTGAL